MIPSVRHVRTRSFGMSSHPFELAGRRCCGVRRAEVAQLTRAVSDPVNSGAKFSREDSVVFAVGLERDDEADEQ